MQKYTKNYFITKNIEIDKIVYGFFSRKGGVSNKNYLSLNCSVKSGDNKKLVEKNIEIAKQNLGLVNHKLKFLKQTHSDRIEMIDNNNINMIINADGSITKNNKIALAVMTADCAPIFIFDSDYSIICSIHVGWKGCLKNIVKNAINTITQMGISCQKLTAIVGPCLSKENFEVDENFINVFKNKNLQYENFFSKNPKQKKPRFDMRKLINFQLQNHIIGKIEHVVIDTYSNEDLFFSHRKSSFKRTLPTGRMINIIGFRDVI